jgi:hypothetical protein
MESMTWEKFDLLCVGISHASCRRSRRKLADDPSTFTAPVFNSQELERAEEESATVRAVSYKRDSNHA